MNLAVSNVESRLNILQGQIYVACRLGAWCFSEDQKLYYSTAPNQEAYHAFLVADQCLKYAYQNTEPKARPHIICGKLGLTWIYEWVYLQQGGRFLVILGPSYLQKSAVEFSLQQLERTGTSPQMHRQHLNVLNDVPALDWRMLRQYAGMLHFTIYEKNIDGDSLTPELPTEAVLSSGINRDCIGDDSLPINDFQRMVGYERLLLDALGKSTTLPVDVETFGELQDFYQLDPLRQIKDNVIIFTALCARSAIASGVPLYTAKSMESDWICKIERSQSPAETAKTLRGMYSAFSITIQNQSECTGLSKAVRECRDYIRMNYTRELKLEDLAKRVGYAEYYLTRKFYKETGEKLTDYIRSVRIDAAKTMLITSREDIQAISEELQFGSRSYFDRVFQQKVGVSPAKYRENVGRCDELLRRED